MAKKTTARFFTLRFFNLAPIPLLLALCGALNAAAIDNMNNTNGFFNFTVVRFDGANSFINPAGYLLPTATYNGDGTVTLASQDTHPDTSEEIVDWTMPNGLSSPFTNLTSNPVLRLNLTGVASARLYDVNLLFFTAGSRDPTFLSEVPWLVNADSSTLSPSVDATMLAPVGSGQYFVRFRLLPPDLSGGVLTLDSIQTTDTPEPAAWSLAVVSLSVLALRRFRVGSRQAA